MESNETRSHSRSVKLRVLLPLVLLFGFGAIYFASYYGIDVWANRGSNRMVRFWIFLGADVNEESFAGLTPLHHAIMQRHLEVSEILLEHGADPNAIDDLGRPPLVWAIRNNDEQAVQLLLDWGASVEVETSEDGSLVDWAREGGNQEIVDKLMESVERRRPSSDS